MRNRKGAALAFALIIMILIVGVVMLAVTYSFVAISDTRTGTYRSAALYVAEAGINKMVYLSKNDPASLPGEVDITPYETDPKALYNFLVNDAPGVEENLKLNESGQPEQYYKMLRVKNDYYAVGHARDGIRVVRVVTLPSEFPYAIASFGMDTIKPGKEDHMRDGYARSGDVAFLNGLKSANNYRDVAEDAIKKRQGKINENNTSPNYMEAFAVIIDGIIGGNTQRNGQKDKDYGRDIKDRLHIAMEAQAIDFLKQAVTESFNWPEVSELLDNFGIEMSSARNGGESDADFATRLIAILDGGGLPGWVPPTTVNGRVRSQSLIRYSTTKNGETPPPPGTVTINADDPATTEEMNRNIPYDQWGYALDYFDFDSPYGGQENVFKYYAANQSPTISGYGTDNIFTIAEINSLMANNDGGTLKGIVYIEGSGEFLIPKGQLFNFEGAIVMKPGPADDRPVKTEGDLMINMHGNRAPFSQDEIINAQYMQSPSIEYTGNDPPIPAFLMQGGVRLDIHGGFQLSGLIYTPGLVELENKNPRSGWIDDIVVFGSVIGGGVYIENIANIDGYGGDYEFNFDQTKIADGFNGMKDSSSGVFASGSTAISWKEISPY